MPTYDFRCPDGHEFEARAGYDIASLPCPVCVQTATRLAVYRLSFAMEGKTPVPLDQRRIKLSKFMEAAQELEHNHQKAEERAQRKLDSPNYFRAGLKQANRVLAGKAPPPKEF